MVVTNVVTMKREVTVTNVIEKTVTVTNVVIEKREPERVLSARKTAPYVVSAKALTANAFQRVNYKFVGCVARRRGNRAAAAGRQDCR